MSNLDIQKYVKKLKIANFRGVFMRNTLPQTPRTNECGVVNLDEIEGDGTHWVAYRKTRDKVVYFDSFGNLNPPKEIVRYFKKCKIYYNYDQYQTYNTYNCGHLALSFLYNNK